MSRPGQAKPGQDRNAGEQGDHLEPDEPAPVIAGARQHIGGVRT
jgi:hypothetical protein